MEFVRNNEQLAPLPHYCLLIFFSDIPPGEFKREKAVLVQEEGRTLYSSKVNRAQRSWISGKWRNNFIAHTKSPAQIGLKCVLNDQEYCGLWAQPREKKDWVSACVCQEECVYEGLLVCVKECVYEGLLLYVKRR